MAEVEKRTAILNATLDLISEHGFHGAPISKIAKQSGVSAGIIYHYFADKDDLIQALYVHIKEHLLEAMMIGNPQEAPWPDSFITLWLNSYQYYVRHPQQTRFIEQYENSPYPQFEENEDLLAKYAWLVQLIDDAQANGHIKDLPFPVIYELTLRVAAGLAKQQIKGGLSLTEDELLAVADACRAAIAR